MIKLLLVDFDGVMSQGRFYVGHPEAYTREFSHLQKVLFQENRDDLLKRWMRGKIDFRTLHRQIAQEVGIDPAIYDVALIESVRRMQLNERMLKTVQEVRATDVQVALFTDNMDIFDEVSVDHHKLADYFDAIYSSSQHGKMKVEDDSLFMRACREFSVEPMDVALVDDSRTSTEAVKGFGGYAFLYESYIDSHLEFTRWLHSIAKTRSS